MNEIIKLEYRRMLIRGNFGNEQYFGINQNIKIRSKLLYGKFRLIWSIFIPIKSTMKGVIDE